ncbi:MAG: hypothetical protein AB1726_01055 [Planctomycetota bacterium]
MRAPSIAALLLAVAAASCLPAPAREGPCIRVAHLGRPGGDPAGFAALRQAFAAANPGYDVTWHPALELLPPAATARVAFLQAGAGEGVLHTPATGASETTALSIGDIVLLRPGQELRGTDGMAALVFMTPVPLPAELPGVVRPDWDPLVTDTPGGCAEEEGAYRRILLTWLARNGPYVYRGLNAHRVRIADSFSHYHPAAGGFDELYLVQMAPPGARVLTSEQVARIEDPATVTPEEAAKLLQERSLAAGDLVYMPRGTMHRGLGGALVQVISVPGFRPNCEVGLDHHLRAIDDRLGLEGSAALPYHEAASSAAVVK